MCSLRCIEPWVVRIVASCWNLANQCLLTFHADRWKSAVWLGTSDLTGEHLVRTDEGVVNARSARRLAEHSWSEENLRAVVATP